MPINRLLLLSASWLLPVLGAWGGDLAVLDSEAGMELSSGKLRAVANAGPDSRDFPSRDLHPTDLPNLSIGPSPPVAVPAGGNLSMVSGPSRLDPGIGDGFIPGTEAPALDWRVDRYRVVLLETGLRFCGQVSASGGAQAIVQVGGFLAEPSIVEGGAALEESRILVPGRFSFSSESARAGWPCCATSAGSSRWSSGAGRGLFPRERPLIPAAGVRWSGSASAGRSRRSGWEDGAEDRGAVPKSLGHLAPLRSGWTRGEGVVVPEAGLEPATQGL